MGADIFEARGKGLRCEPTMCHLVAIGAHDGHGRTMPYTLRKVTPANLQNREQGQSWFKWDKIDLPHDGHPIVAQIYFPYGDKALDQTQDVVVLKAVIAHYRWVLGQNERVELEFVGHADARGAASFNDKLARQRAEAVRRYVDKGIRAGASSHMPTVLGYKSTVTSLGESRASGAHVLDRRVDIVLRTITAKHYVREDAVFITGTADGNLTRKLLFRSWGGGGLGLGKVGVEALEIEIKNPNTGKRAFYVYGGGSIGIGLPISVSVPRSDYEEQEIPKSFGFLDVDEFEGPGSIHQAMLVGGGQRLRFDGPTLHHSKMVTRQKGIEFYFAGVDPQVGVSFGTGKWRKQPYTNEKERDEFNRKLQEQQKR
jgi:outer membrane protein OmpA-like peptidoglycan-associated protein